MVSTMLYRAVMMYATGSVKVMLSVEERSVNGSAPLLEIN
jgi:hypothetical protein